MIKTLGKLVKIKTGKLNANASDENGSYPFFTCAKEISRINKFAFDSESVLVAGNGELNVKYYEGKFNAYQRTYVIDVIDKTQLSTKYVFYFLDNYIQKLRDGAIGGVIKYIKLNHLTDIQIPVPDIQTQNKIVDVLDRASSLVKKREETIELLDELLRATFLDMFGDPVSNPKGWKKLPLSEFGEIITGNTPPRNNPENYDDGFIEWIKTGNIILNEIFPTKAEEYLSETGAMVGRTVEEGAIIVACIAGSLSSIGRSALVNRKIAFNQQINAIQPNSDLSSYFLYYLLSYSSEYIQSFASKGMKKIITKGNFEKILFIKPPYEDQVKFEHIAKVLNNQKESINISQKGISILFNSLVQKVFNGELNFNIDFELDALVREIDLEKKVNDLSTISGDIAYLQRLIDKLNAQEFEDKEMYDKAKHAVFQLLKENKKVTQEYNEKSNNVKLVLK